jgi:hypothetical protein
MEQNNVLRSNGYNVVEKWEWEWNTIKHHLDDKKELEEQARQQTINIRDALFGGRTEGFKRHVKCNDDQNMCDADVVSLYPIVNALDDYALVYGRYVKKYSWWYIKFGLAKVDVEPPKDLYIHVLPDKGNCYFIYIQCLVNHLHLLNLS